jgi:adenylate cyclase class 2
MALEHETELKLFVTKLIRIQTRLESLSARLLHARQHESNLRLDRPDLDLEKENKILRLRFDGETRITFKGPSSISQGALSRTEIEISVDDFDVALHLFEALGYSVTATYEKYRTTFEYKNCMIMLDELPFGNFVEIEGENTESLYAVAESLGLNAETAIQKSYLELFKDVREKLGFEHTNLSFKAFSGIQLSPEQLGVIPSDNALS